MNAEAPDFPSRALAVRRAFDAALLLVNRGDMNAAAVVLARAVKLMTALLDDIGSSSRENKTYFDDIQKRKMPKLKDDETLVARLAKNSYNENITASPKDFLAAFGRLDRCEKVLYHEIQRIFPGAFGLRRAWAKSFIYALSYWKTFTAIGLAVVIAIAGTQLAGKMAAKKHSLTGVYFRNQQLSGPSKTRLDRVINFAWRSEPLPSFPSDLFSVRWTGYLLAPRSGQVTIITENDDGARLWIDDKLLIDDWFSHSTKSNRAVVDLTEGPHKITLEHFDDYSYAQMKLLWHWPDWDSPEIIASKYLAPNEAALQP